MSIGAREHMNRNVNELPEAKDIIQANLVKAVKHAPRNNRNPKTHDWAIYFFFRKLEASEVSETISTLTEVAREWSQYQALKQSLTEKGEALSDEEKKELKRHKDKLVSSQQEELVRLDFENPAFSEATRSLVSVVKSMTENIGDFSDQSAFQPPGPQSNEQDIDRFKDQSKTNVDPFLAWLKLITGSPEQAAGLLSEFIGKLGIQKDTLSLDWAIGTVSQPRTTQLFSASVEEGAQSESSGHDEENELTEIEFAIHIIKLLDSALSSRETVSAFFRALAENDADIGKHYITGGLTAVAFHEWFRQIGASHNVALGGLLRSEGKEFKLRRLGSHSTLAPFDTAAMNLAFTWNGLKALNLDATTLNSFPEAFREGMASRAEQLGDTGLNAPENWYGELGQKSVHGYFTGTFSVSGVLERQWAQLRKQVRDFNDRTPDGLEGRRAVNRFFRFFGMEIVHIELGQDPYHVDPHSDEVKPTKVRREHFGFRDGISQPRIDLGLGHTQPGAGNPSRNRTWEPVAPGEIFLGLPDEDGNVSNTPVNQDLARGGTYLVFRKLAQDVIGFKNYLARQRPGSPKEQEKLAAQMVGRWPDGTSLIHSPFEDRRVTESAINDFLYAADDPDGIKCPLGSHTRRSNPRDIGGRDNVKRHRLLRRSKGYGGRLLTDDAQDDLEERGLLFIAANSRIETQFEVIQKQWLNTGEFLGQTGLDKCPLTGNNDGTIEDRFFASGRVAPETHIPKFVENRGGDYFFAPSVKAIKRIAGRHKFPPADSGNVLALPYGGFTFGEVETPALFSEKRLKQFFHAFESNPTLRSIKVRPPKHEDMNPFNTYVEVDDPEIAASVVFVGRHKDVAYILSENEHFSVRHYRNAARKITRGQDTLLGTDCILTPGSRTEMTKILNDAWLRLANDRAGNPSNYSVFAEKIVRLALEKQLKRVWPSGRTDLAQDLATASGYALCKYVVGVPGPNWLTELAVALPFYRRHIGEIPPDWLLSAKGEKIDDPGVVTMTVWSITQFLVMLGNVQNQQEILDIAAQATSELVAHIDELLDQTRRYRPIRARTLLEAFVLEDDHAAKKGEDELNKYYQHTRNLLAEIAASVMVTLPGRFADMMSLLLDIRIHLPRLVSMLKANPIYGKPPPYCSRPEINPHGKATPERPLSGLQLLVYECDRLRSMKVPIMRYCERDYLLEDGQTIAAGEWVAAMTNVAKLDPLKYGKTSYVLSLYPWTNTPPRDPADYLMFGSLADTTRGRSCWGRDRLALMALTNCIEAAATLPGLHRIAGPKGDFDTFAKVTVGFKARFSPRPWDTIDWSKS